jgi:hypothetical protein
MRTIVLATLLLGAATLAAADLVIIGKGLGYPGGSTPWSGC